MYIVTIIEPSGRLSVEERKVKPSYIELKKLVALNRHRSEDVMVELIPEFKKYSGKRCEAYSDEEGRLKNLPANRAASIIWHEQMQATGRPFNKYDLAGNVVIVQKG